MKTLIILTVLSLTLLKELFTTFRKPPMKVISEAGDDMNTGENRSMREKKSRNRNLMRLSEQSLEKVWYRVPGKCFLNVVPVFKFLFNKVDEKYRIKLYAQLRIHIKLVKI